MTTTVHEIIVHCQKQIKKDPPPEKLLHYLRRLSRLKITIDDLRETGVGKTVNQLSRLEGEVGQYAGKIVEEWKAMVETQSEEPSSSSSSSSSSGESDSENSDLEIDENYQAQSSPVNVINNPIINESDHERLEEDDEEVEEDSGHRSASEARSSGDEIDLSKTSSHFDDNGQDSDDSHSSWKAKTNGHEKKSRSHASSSSSSSSSDSEKGGVHRDKLNSVPKDYHHQHGRHREHPKERKENIIQIKQEKLEEQPRSRDRDSQENIIIQVKQERPEEQPRSRERDIQENIIQIKQEKPEERRRSRERDSHVIKSESRHNHHYDKSSSKEKERKHRDRSKERHKETKEDKSEKKHHHHRDRDRDREHRGDQSHKKHEKDKSEKSSEHRRHESKHDKERKRDKQKHEEKSSKPMDHKMKNGESSQESQHRESSSNKRKQPEDSPASSATPKEKDPKKIKLISKLKNEEIDSTSGVNFADVLGCLDKTPITPKSSKKIPAGSVVSTSSKSSRKNGALESIIPINKPIKTEKSNDYGSSHSKSKSSTYAPPSYAPPVPTFASPSKPPPLPLALDIDEKPFRTRYEDSLVSMNEPANEFDALSSMMSSRKDRTKVYSGTKTGYVGKVPTLFDMCIRIIQENLDCLGYTGGVPYDILKPALERATVKQLEMIEYHNPYLEEQTDELWKFHCKRDCRGEVPQEFESYRELYLRCMEERQNKLSKLTSLMKKKTELATPVRKAKLAYVEPSARGPRFNKSKAATIKNGMQTLKVREEKGPNSSGLSYSASAGGKTTQNMQVEQAAIVITSNSRASTSAAPSLPRESSSSSAAKMKPRKAPLMQKTLKLIKSVYRR